MISRIPLIYRVTDKEGGQVKTFSAALSEKCVENTDTDSKRQGTESRLPPLTIRGGTTFTATPIPSIRTQMETRGSPALATAGIKPS
jgi:hypothetical protein